MVLTISWLYYVAERFEMGTYLTAMMMPCSLSKPLYTLPKDPLPISSPNWKLERWWSFKKVTLTSWSQSSDCFAQGLQRVPLAEPKLVVLLIVLNLLVAEVSVLVIVFKVWRWGIFIFLLFFLVRGYFLNFKSSRRSDFVYLLYACFITFLIQGELMRELQGEFLTRRRYLLLLLLWLHYFLLQDPFLLRRRWFPLGVLGYCQRCITALRYYLIQLTFRPLLVLCELLRLTLPCYYHPSFLWHHLALPFIKRRRFLLLLGCLLSHHRIHL